MKVTYGIAGILIRTVSRIFFRIKISGRENVPKSGGFILASNHISYFDPPLMGSFCGRELHFMAKKELFRNKIFGALIRHFNSHPVNRSGFDKSAIETAVSLLKNDQPMLIFPEGTRAKGVDFLPARPGVALIARAAEKPIIPALVYGSNSLKNCFLGKKRMSIIFGSPIMPAELSSFPRDKNGYRLLADTILNRIKGLKVEIGKNRIGS